MALCKSALEDSDQCHQSCSDLWCAHWIGESCSAPSRSRLWRTSAVFAELQAPQSETETPEHVQSGSKLVNVSAAVYDPCDESGERRTRPRARTHARPRVAGDASSGLPRSLRLLDSATVRHIARPLQTAPSELAELRL